MLFEREVDYILAVSWRWRFSEDMRFSADVFKLPFRFPKAISKMQRENIAAMAAKQSSVDDFMDYVDVSSSSPPLAATPCFLTDLKTFETN